MTTGIITVVDYVVSGYIRQLSQRCVQGVRTVYMIMETIFIAQSVIIESISTDNVMG